MSDSVKTVGVLLLLLLSAVTLLVGWGIDHGITVVVGGLVLLRACVAMMGDGR